MSCNIMYLLSHVQIHLHHISLFEGMSQWKREEEEEEDEEEEEFWLFVQCVTHRKASPLKYFIHLFS